MKCSFKSIWNYLTQKLSITITPSPEYEIKSFSISRIILMLIFIITISSIIILSSLFIHYQNHYYEAKDRLNSLQGVKKENIRLKDQLYTLTKDTERIRESIKNLKQHNKEIRQLIDKTDKNGEKQDVALDLKLTSIYFNENNMKDSLPIGGKFQLYYLESKELIQRMHYNIKKVKKKIPEQKRDLNNLEKSVKKYNAKKAATPTVWPVLDNGEGYISSEFGWRTSPQSGKEEFHEGLDIGVWYNTPVIATAQGRVTYVGWKSGYGKIIYIKHGFGYTTRYGHLKEIKVDNGEKVEKGQVIGLSGNTGRSTGPHLHYEVRLNSIPQNPRAYIGGN